MRPLPLLLLCTACRVGGFSDRPPCQVLGGYKECGARYVIFDLEAPDLQQPLRLELIYTPDQSLLPDGLPVVVVLPGGFSARISPVAGADRSIATNSGIAALYVNFPTEEGDFVAGQIGDYRGRAARRATAAALQYATGGVEDLDGCTLADRLPMPLSELAPLLHGQSNGGNLILSTLADPSLDLPPISGVTFFETPISSQLATVEVGSYETPLSLYQEGSCTWEPIDGFFCPLDYDRIVWDEELEEGEGMRGAVWFDTQDDGSFDAQSDHVVWGLRPIIDGQLQLVYSPFLAEAIEGLANAPETLMSSSEAGDFWTPRDGSRSVLAAVEAYPDLPAIVLGTEEDHALGIEDHAHISGLAGALLASGAPWVRVNPDEAYVALTSGQELSWSDNQANLQLEPGDEGVSMLPEEDDLNLDPRVYTTAALVELSHRAWTASWQDDLEWVLME